MESSKRHKQVPELLRRQFWRPLAAAMSLLVEADEQEPAILAVARLVADLEHDEALPATAVSWLEKGELQPLLSRLAGSQLLTAAGEKDAEAAFTVLAHAADALPEDQALAAVTAIADRVAEADAAAGPLRLRVLFALFNAVPQPRCRFVVLVRALQLATATGQADALTHLVPRVSSWSSEWHLEPAQLRSLRLAVYELLDKSGASSKQSLAALVDYLALFEVRFRVLAVDTYPTGRADALTAAGRGWPCSGWRAGPGVQGHHGLHSRARRVPV